MYGSLEHGREVLLTFDDGPHPKWTPALLDCLAKEKLKGVFFVLGKQVAAPGGKEIVRRAFNEGHRIGSHTYNHLDLRKLSEEQVRGEIRRTEDLIAEYLTDHKLLRPPYGAHNQTVDRVVRELNYYPVLWSVDPEDWKTTNKPTKWIDLALAQIGSRAHSVFLCHDIQETTVEHFPEFLSKVRSLPDVRFIDYA